MLNHMINHLDVFMCPGCGGALTITSEEIECIRCRNHYQIEDEIPLLFVPNEWDSSKKDVTHMIKAFYETTPFPNYDEFENTGDLIQKAQTGVFARLLNEQVPFNIRVLEVGCGTGQLSNFLGAAHRFVFGTDICLNSLKLAQRFKSDNKLQRVGFYQMNLFRPIFKQESFPLVICNGVLHHTSDPFWGFKTISGLVKRGGYIVIGLYNSYGRVTNDIRRKIFRSLGVRFKFLDPRLRNRDVSDLKKYTWFLDQYHNPHESKHTFGEVLRWFDQTGFDFVNSIPKLKAFEAFSENERLFQTNPRGNLLDHLMVQAHLTFTGKEGGFFVMIGRRRYQKSEEVH